LKSWIAGCGALGAFGLGPNVCRAEWLLAPGAGLAATQNVYLEYGLIIVLFGGALFAVCRSSNRN
jgi:hypothetical protein